MEVNAAIQKAAEMVGYSPLKIEQKECIQAFMSGRDVFPILPTGFGKTVCYACLPSVFNLYRYGHCDSTLDDKSLDDKSIIIVVSTLTSLIKDQVENMTKRYISAGFIDCNSTGDIRDNVNCGVYSVMFMSQELLVSKFRCLFESSVYKKRLVGLVVDEAHCVVKW